MDTSLTKNKTDVSYSMLRKIGYGMGEAGSQLSWTLISSYLTVYYSDVVGLTPIIISTVMLVARILTAFWNPVFGSIAENTHTKWGRYRPYILFGTPFLALFSCLMFLNINGSTTLKAIWCTVTYLICSILYTMVNGAETYIPMSMTTVNTERVSLNAVKGIVSNVASVIMSAVTMPMLIFFGGGNSSTSKSYFMVALIFAILSVPCFYICYFSSKEVVSGGSLAQNEKRNVIAEIFKSFWETIKDRDSGMLILAMILFLTGIFGRLGVMLYYFIYIVHKPMLMASFSTAMMLGMLVVNFYTPYLLNHFDKKYVGVLSCVLEIICCVIFFFSKNSLVIVITGFFYGAFNMVTLVSQGLVGEIIDDRWLRTGVRADGVIGSSIGFAAQIGNTIGGAIGIAILGAVGYVAHADLSQAVLTRMNIVINLGPALCFALAIIPFMMIRMTNKKGRENETKVKAMTENEQ
ncbi:MFS transporter [Limosilactobacillus mucosae]|jgi:GPH family glycoside/pentoside/hexuronide:cation symporter/probable glucitol transport protein GutA|uniref:Na+ xyloside symporter related transporter n=2 Tax=Limosilactobacillus mucosae TaxID=97478 RepID=A0A0R1P2L0_LIMMU|nr:glycoside-pentoside-hexuronide (GPH):cation symporter [Limosilactobacillus mucosae]MDO5013030.1 glycoside-pentoside-hexuronide (GPH):cation symporter [Lactobacillaceae bacterium]KRL26721.1 na+ xyloside symporter related transporter [Limosilactobacillus mucosae DSM 13345]MCI1489773.1 glycoside-pentoside-hexuronide (GPH):cation symporter [Limosilactobacillus mucosae]MCI1526786.1 glycoside-pentoside-hexuronide (GPH):cation symporter [Limosilactobacillus mucosae]QOL70122.1 MFS transporter [Limo